MENATARFFRLKRQRTISFVARKSFLKTAEMWPSSQFVIAFLGHNPGEESMCVGSPFSAIALQMTEFKDW